ncbi:MAG: hypothetical protein IH586_05210, partial [Anaerolineaceae bacterium]|nr:hypothetical protein [Anaerolineaceae bacterium]
MNNQAAENQALWRQLSASFSFRYADRSLGNFPAEWAPRTTTELLADGGSLERISGSDPQTGLRVTQTIRRFVDSPALDWVMEFENGGDTDAPILEAVSPLDVTLPIQKNERLRLHHANGSDCRKDDFLPLLSELPPNGRKMLCPAGGRSSDVGFPFMNLQYPGGGLVIAIGWTGQWAANFERSADSIRISAGMERIHLRLHPGEKIRTPRILLLPWQGDDMEVGQNLLRQLLLAHYLPRINGELVLPPTAQCLQAYFYLTG